MSNTANWVSVSKIKVGDYIHRWGNWLEVIGKEMYGNIVIIVVKDGDETKRWQYNITAELDVKND